MKFLYLRIAVLICLSSSFLSAADLCVRPTATGTGNGSDWNNALGATFTPQRGNTYYLAAGSYPGKTWNTSGTTPVVIRKATAEYPGSRTGWSDSLASGVVTWTSGWVFDGAGYITLDGVTGTGRAGHGFVFPDVRNYSSYAIYAVNGASNVTIAHCEIYAYPAGTSYSAMTTNRHLTSIWKGTAASTGPVTFTHCWLHDVFGCPFLWRTANGVTIEHCVIERNKSTSALHAEGISDDESDNVIIRYSEWYEIEGTAFVAGINGSTGSSMDNWQIYGNKFWADSSWVSSLPTLIYVYRGGSNMNFASNWKIVNNTIASKNGGLGVVFQEGGHSNVDFSNNYVYVPRTNTDTATAVGSYIAFGLYGVDSSDYNVYSGTVHKYEFVPGAHEATLVTANGGLIAPVESALPFYNWATGDFHLHSTASGATSARVLGAPYNVDAAGTTRQSIWSAGAYQTDAAPTGVTTLIK